MVAAAERPRVEVFADFGGEHEVVFAGEVFALAELVEGADEVGDERDGADAAGLGGFLFPGGL